MAQRIEMKHPLAIRWFHWINFPVLAIMVWSGLLIYGANRVYRIGFGSWTLYAFDTQFAERLHLRYRLAEGLSWHFAFMWLFALNGLAYVLYVGISGQWRHLLPRKGTMREALQVILFDLKITKNHPPRSKFNGAQRLAYTSVIVMGFGSLVTGLAIYKPTQAAWLTGLCGGYQSARWIHFWLTAAFCLFFVVHVGQVARAGWNNFRAMVTGRELVNEADAEPQGGAAA